MSLNDVLNQDEIDALLSGGDDEEEEIVEEEEGGAQSFDFSHDRIVRGRMPTLEMINERFARNLRVSLFDFLRRTPELSTQGVKIMKYSEYVNTLFLPTSLNLVRMRPLRGTALFILDAKLVYILVDNFFGGEGKFHNKIEGRDFTPTEGRIIMRLLYIAFNDLKNAWKAVLPVDFEYQSSEVNPAMANIVSPSEVVVVSRFRIELEGGAGEMHVTIPYGMLEPIRDLLDSGVQSDKDDTDDRWIQSLHDEIYDAKIDVKAIVAKKYTNLGAIHDIKEGDIIPIDMPEASIMVTNGVPTFLVKLGASDGKYALKVVSQIVDTKDQQGDKDG